VLLNDSLFFFSKGLDQIFSALQGPQDFIGLTEVLEYHYHVQSFMLSFGEQVIKNPRFQRYWRRYRPISSRRWSIHRGEVGLTRTVTKAGFKPHILFHGSQLTKHLQGQPMTELFDALRLLPVYLRHKLHTELQTLESRDAIESLTKSVQNLSISRGRETDAELTRMRAQSIEKVLQKVLRASDHFNSVENWKLRSFVSRIISRITLTNQIHVGGFLFMKYLGLSVIKRDIFYREVYTMEDVYEILSLFQEPLLEEVIADIRQKGTASNLKGFRRLLYRHGSI